MAIFQTIAEIYRAQKVSRQIKKMGDLRPLFKVVHSDDGTWIPAQKARSPHTAQVTIEELNDENLAWFIEWLEKVVAPINKLLTFLHGDLVNRALNRNRKPLQPGVTPGVHSDGGDPPSASMMH